MTGRLLSALLTLLLIPGGTYAILRSFGLVLRSGSAFSFTSHPSFPVQQSAQPTLVAGIIALAAGILFAFTLARFLRWVPIVRLLVIVVQLAALGLLIGVPLASQTY